MNNKITMSFGREGLHVSRDGKEIAVIDITQLSLLGLEYGCDLDVMPSGWWITPREKVIKWLETQSQKRARIT